jgi:hypothetical protein
VVGPLQELQQQQQQLFSATARPAVPVAPPSLCSKLEQPPAALRSIEQQQQIVIASTIGLSRRLAVCESLPSWRAERRCRGSITSRLQHG